MPARASPRTPVRPLSFSHPSSALPPFALLCEISTAIGRDERPGGFGLLHHVPAVSTVPERPGADHDRARPTGRVRVRVRGGQTAGRRSARMGRLSRPIPGQVQRNLRGKKVFSACRFYAELEIRRLADGQPDEYNLRRVQF